MKRAIFCLVYCLCVSLIAGCQETAKKQKPESNMKTQKIPKIMVGVWEANSSEEGAKWAFEIEPDGSIPKLVHPIAGKVNVKEGGYEAEGPDPGTYATFVMGPCKSSFDAATGIFTVHIVLDEFDMKLPQGEITGKSDDYFKGKVSKDGKTWKADWFFYSSLDGGSPPNIDEVNANPGKLVFHKLDIDKLAKPKKVK